MKYCRPTSLICRVLIVLLFLAPLLAFDNSRAHAGTLPAMASKEQKIKAAFIYNFLKFTEGIHDKDGVLDVCVYADPGFVDAMKPVQNKTVNKYVIHVHDDESLADMRKCNVVFIGDEAPNAEEIIEKAKDLQVLTIGDLDDFAKKHGMIGLFKQNDRIRFAVNKDAASRAQITFSAKLLELASSVY